MSRKKKAGTIPVSILALLMFLTTAGEVLQAQEQSPANPGTFAQVLIQKKFKQAVMTNRGRFQVTSETEIYTDGNRKISYDLLPAPCEAKIFYYAAANQDQTALKIEITRVSAGAVRTFMIPVPQ